MSIMQERVLSLIPRKPDGKYVHGAKADFARELGFKSGAIVSDWESGKSDSYKNYLYLISALHGVSVEYLRGETDDPGIKEAPDPKIEGEGLSATVQELFDFIDTANDDELNELLRYAQFLMSKR